MKKDWFRDWFESKDYLDVYNHRDEKDAQLLTELILNTINPTKEKIFLDAACGTGRHSLILASLGYKVIGFDLSRNLLFKAKEVAANKKYNINFLLADLRNVQFKNRIDIVLNLFTSFGYFSNDEENFQFVKNASFFIKKEGYYILDFLNLAYLAKTIVPKSERTIDGKNIIEHREIRNDRIIKTVIINNENIRKEFHESVKLYDSNFIIKKFNSFGFKLFKSYGDYFGNIYNEGDSPRLILIFQK